MDRCLPLRRCVGVGILLVCCAAKTGAQTPPASKTGRPGTNAAEKSSAKTASPARKEESAGEEPGRARVQPKSAGSGVRTAGAVQEEDAGRASTGRPRPAAETLRVQKLSPELEQILVDWETESSKFKRMAGKVIMTRRDPVWHVEQRSEGDFMFEAPDRGYYEVKGSKIAKASAVRKDLATGAEWKLQPGPHEHWVCNGKWVIQIDERERTYQKLEIPPELQGENIIYTPLPFLFGLKAEDAKRRFEFELVREKPELEAKRIRLWVFPKTSADRQNYQKAEILLDRQRYVPIAVRTFGPNAAAVQTADEGSKAPRQPVETIYSFMGVDVNPLRLPLISSDPFNPNLRSYQLVVSPAGEEDAPSAPAGGGSARPKSPPPRRTATNARE